jgi:hypothetical protein
MFRIKWLVKCIVKWLLIYMFVVFITILFLFFSRYDDIVNKLLPKLIKN